MLSCLQSPSEPYLFAAAIRPQDGLLLKQLLVRLADLFDLLAAVPSRLDRVEQNQEHRALLDDHAAGAAELSKPHQEGQAVREARGDLVVDKLLKFFRGHLGAVGPGGPEEQFRAGKPLAGEWGRLAVFSRNRGVLRWRAWGWIGIRGAGNAKPKDEGEGGDISCFQGDAPLCKEERE